MTSGRRGACERRSQAVRAAAWALTLALTLASNAPSSRAQGTPPTVVARTPAAAATGVSVQTTVSAVFSEPIQPATLIFELRNASNQLVAAQVAYDAPTLTATLTPNAALVGSQQYTVTARSALDLTGNQMAQVSWSFSTGSAGFVDETLPQTGLVDPMVIAFDRDDNMFVAEKSGRILVYDTIDSPTGVVLADLRVNVYNFWDRGLMGMALHPNFPSTPYIYVLYAYDAVPGGAAPRWGSSSNPQVGDPCPTPPGPTTDGCVVTGRLARLDISNTGAWPLNHTNEVPLVTDWFQQFPSHSVGTLAFGPDNALYASAGDGASFNYADFGQTPSNPSVNAGGANNDPTNEGGALRSQDLRTSGDNVTLDGTVIRIDPNTGQALPDNPGYTTQTDPNGKRIIAHGFRNPFRFTFRPGTSELWVGDVGWFSWEEINRIANPTDATVDNMGWPCYEGNPQQSGYSGFSICQGLYNQGAGAVVAPYFRYQHQQVIVPGETCGTGSSSVSGLAFYSGSGYPAAYQDALFFADYSRKCVWAMRKGTNGLPDTATVQTIIGAAGPVVLAAAPGGDILYAGFDDDRLHRIRYVGGNLPPTAAIAATPSSGPSPLNVSFTAAGSSDPEGQTLTYAWDLDGDGSFDDGTGQTRSWTYTGAAATTITARVLVSDTGGQSAVAAAPILLNGTRPTAVIDTPTGSLQWKVGDPIAFSGRGVDPDEPSGELPPSALQWELNVHHCPSDCHVHGIETFNAVASGSFNAPDHEYPSYLELRLTVTDPTGATGVASVNLQPQTTSLTFNTNLAVPLTLAVNGVSSATPFSRTVIVGSSNSLNAQSPQTIGSTTYTFNSWSDLLPQLHQITAPATPTTYTASYDAGQSTTTTATFQVAAGSDDANQQATSITIDAPTVFLGNADASQVNTTGFRFAGVAIPPGAVVTAASLQVTPSSTQWSAMSFEVAAEAAVNSATFSAASGPSSRPLLPPRATHFSNAQWLTNTWYSASDELAPLVQAVVAQPGWAAGNALSIILRGTDFGWARKFAQAFEGNASRAARLVVTYSVPPSGPSISINDVTVTEGNSGTTNAVFTVTLSAQPGATPVTVNYATSNATATAPSDYTPTSGPLSFTGTTTTRTITVPILGDTVGEANETFAVTLSGAVGGSILDNTGIGTITNDDAPVPTLTIADTAVAEGNAGTTTASFTVTLSAQPGATPVTVNYATGNGTAAAPGDYTAITNGSLTFSGTTTVQTIPVTVLGDTAVEPNETFTVTLSSPVGAALADGVAIGTINNDDAPLPTLTIADTAVTEGNAGTTVASFTVTLSAQPGATPVTVSYATGNGTAVAPGDYTAITSGSLTFSGTTTAQTIPVTVLGDTTVEPAETFTVTLSLPSGATLADGVATGTINNDDVPPPTQEQTVTLQIAGGENDTYESAGTFTANDPSLWIGTGSGPSVTGLRFTGVAIPPNAFIVSARFEVTPAVAQWSYYSYEAAAEAAVSSAPFTDTSRPSLRPFLPPRVLHGSNEQWLINTWYAPEGDFAPLVQAVVDQPAWASGNAMAIMLRAGDAPWTRKQVLSAEGSATRAPRLIVTYRGLPTGPSLSIADVTQAEGNSGTTNAGFVVTLSAPPGATPVTVNYATGNGTAVAPGDYTAVTNGSLSFTGTTTTQTINIPIVGDTTVEPTEAFTVTLSGPVGATLLDGVATGTITNDDVVLPTLSIADVTQAEGNSGTTNAGFVVTLSAPPGATPVTVNYATGNGTAVAPGDYTAVTNGSLSFTGTTTTQIISIPIVGDTTVEPTEAFTVTLSGPVGATLLDGVATGTIANDDGVPPTLSIADVTQAEGHSGTTNAGFVVTLSAQPGASTITVNYTTGNGTAVAPGDYTAVTNGSLSFTGTTTTQTINIPIVGDTTVEPTEAFTVTLTGPVGATLLDGVATGTIANDDGVAGEQTVTFQIAAGADDVQEEGTSFSATGNTLWIGNGQLPGTYVAGLRFTGVTIPVGAVIVSARLEVTPAATQWNQLAYEAGAEAAAASAPFSTTSRPSQRTLLAPRVLHDTNIQWPNNSWQPLAGDLAPLLQGVISQAGWASGNPLSLILRGNGPAFSRKRFTTAEGTAGRAPRLVVTYRTVP